MMSPTYNADFSTAKSTEYASIASRFQVGKTITTNIPGTVGHNYAKWEIVSISNEVIDGKCEMAYSRVN